MVNTVAVIGSGISGLTAVKCCLDEGLTPTCFERRDHIAGLWHYTEKAKEGHTTVMKNTIANISKEIMAFSDFPPAPEAPVYMHNTDLEEYLNFYADKFGLREHIRLNKEVIHVYETDDHMVTGRWNVKVKDVTSDNINLLTFDAVLICTGRFSKPVIPAYAGIEEFKGRLIHTQNYKSSKGCEDKRVVIVGMGNSAADAACDISGVSRQVFISSRNGSWILTRLSKKGHPIDMALFSRFTYTLLTLFPSVMNKLVMNQCNNKIDHFRYGINPRYIPARSTSTINDQLPYKLLIGAIKMKPNVKRFCGNDVEFVDGTRIQNVDVVVFGTGYLPEFPFLDKSVIGEDKTQLYLGMFPPERQSPTLATIGCFRVQGPVLPVIEMQSRLASRVLKGEVTLPDRTTIHKSIEANNRESQKKGTYSVQAVTQLDYFPYMDKLAKMIGCKPNFWKLFFSDSILARKCVFGPGTSYQYRLVGPGHWVGAREAIFDQWDRTYYSLTEGKQTKTPTRKWNIFNLFVFLACAAAIAVIALNRRFM